jgi:hypothetical protein
MRMSPPACAYFAYVEDEGRVFEIAEFNAVRIDLSQGRPLRRGTGSRSHIELEVITVRADDGLGEEERLVAARPMEGRLEHDLLLRLALRLIEAGGELGFAKDVGDAVITDSVARAEVCVRVVVEGAPADSSGVLRVGGELVVNPGMAQGVLALVRVVIGRLGGEGVSNELGIQVARMIGLLQGEAEIVHGKDVFEKLGFLEVPYAACGPGIVECMRQCVGLGIEVMVILGLVDAYSPENDGRVIPIAPNHAADVIDGRILPSLVADMLPSGDFFEYQETDLVAAIEKVA